MSIVFNTFPVLKILSFELLANFLVTERMTLALPLSINYTVTFYKLIDLF